MVCYIAREEGDNRDEFLDSQAFWLPIQMAIGFRPPCMLNRPQSGVILWQTLGKVRKSMAKHSFCDNLCGLQTIKGLYPHSQFSSSAEQAVNEGLRALKKRIESWECVLFPLSSISFLLVYRGFIYGLLSSGSVSGFVPWWYRCNEGDYKSLYPTIVLASTFLLDMLSFRNPYHVFCYPQTSMIGSNNMLSLPFFFFSLPFVLASVEFNSWHYHSCKRNARDLDPILT